MQKWQSKKLYKQTVSGEKGNKTECAYNIDMVRSVLVIPFNEMESLSVVIATVHTIWNIITIVMVCSIVL